LREGEIEESVSEKEAEKNNWPDQVNSGKYK
jgi:hypothetical protein